MSDQTAPLLLESNTPRAALRVVRTQQHALSDGAMVYRQLFQSGVRALPLVCVVAFGTGGAIVLQTTMAPTPPSGEFGRMLVVVVLRELAPLLTATLIAGHSGTAMAADLRHHPSAAHPRVLAIAIAVFALSIYFAMVAMLGGYMVSAAFTLRTVDAVHAGLQQELGWLDLPLFVLKTGGLGWLVGSLAHKNATTAKDDPVQIAEGASRTFVRSLLYGAVYSASLTFVLYLITGAPQPP